MATSRPFSVRLDGGATVQKNGLDGVVFDALPDLDASCAFVRARSFVTLNDGGSSDGFYRRVPRPRPERLWLLQ